MKNSIFPFFGLRALASVTFVLIFSQLLDAQRNWYGNAANESFSKCLALPAGPAAAAHYFVAGGQDNFATISKIKATGAVQSLVWVHRFTGPNGEQLGIWDMQESHGNNLIVAATYRPDPAQPSNMKIYVMEVNATTGVIIVAKTIERVGDNRLYFLRITKTISDPNCIGSYILASWRAAYPSISDDILVTKLDYSLNPIWAYEYGSPNNDDQSHGLIPTTTGGAIIGGYSNLGGAQGFLMTLDANGTQLPICTATYASPANTNITFNNILRTNPTANELVFNARYQNFNVNSINRGVVGKVNLATCNVTIAREFNPGHDVDLGALAQTPTATPGSIYTGYTIPNTGNGAKQHILRFSNAIAPQGQRDGLTGAGLNGIHCTTTKVVTTGSKAGPFGMLDNVMSVMGNALNSGDVCNPVTPLTVTPLTLTKTNVTFAQTNVMSLLTVGQHCVFVPILNNNVVSCDFPLAKPADATETQSFAEFNPSSDMEGFQLVSRSNGEAPPESKAEKIAEFQDFELFPNPAAETVEILFNVGGEEPIERSVQIFDLNGKLVKTQKVSDAEQSTIDLRDLPKGIYSIKVDGGAAQKLTKM